MNTLHKQQKGFTIIEVVLVLAIAGLIFLMVFVALPSLQKGQRDAQRKTDLSRVQVQMQDYLNSTKGAAPTSDGALKKFVENYLDGATDSLTAGDKFKDPKSGDPYVFKYGDAPSIGQISYFNKASCKTDGTGEADINSAGASRDFAFTIKLENQKAPFCIDNKSS